MFIKRGEKITIYIEVMQWADFDIPVTNCILCSDKNYVSLIERNFI